jgi:hypothetical protein
MSSNSRRWSPGIRRPKVYRQMERSGRNSRRAGMVLTEIPPDGSADTRCAKVGDQDSARSVWRRRGKRNESDRVFPHSFVFLSPWAWPLSRPSGTTGSPPPNRRFPELPLYHEPRNPSVLALANPDPPSSPSHLIAFVGIATAIKNGTDGLDESTV